MPARLCSLLADAGFANAESAVLANDLREDGFTVVSLDTGWVRTETGNTTEVLGKSPPLDVLTSVAGALHHLLRSVSCLPTFIYNKYQNQ